MMERPQTPATVGHMRHSAVGHMRHSASMPMGLSTPAVTKVWRMDISKGQAWRGSWLEIGRSPAYMAAPPTTYSLTPWKVAGSLSRPQSAASLPHQRAVGLASRPSSASPATLNLFGFSAPVLKDKKPKVPPRPPPPSRDSVLRKQIWSALGGIEGILVQWIATERLPDRPRPSSRKSTSEPDAEDDPLAAAAAEAAVEAAALERREAAKVAADEALLAAEEAFPPIAQARKAALAAHDASLAAVSAKFKPKKGGPTEAQAAPELVEALAAAEADFQSMREAVQQCKQAAAQTARQLELAREDSANKAKSLALIEFDKRLRANHMQVTRRHLPCRLPYVLRKARAKVDERQEDVRLRFDELWNILDLLGLVDPKQKPAVGVRMSEERRACGLVFTDAKQLYGEPDQPPPPPPPPPPAPLADGSIPSVPPKPLALGGTMSLGALRRCCQAAVEPPPAQARVLSAWEKTMNPERLKVRLSQSLGRMAGLFRTWDADGNGLVSLEEFGRAVAALGIEADDDVVSIVFSEYDTDDSGEIHYVEYMRHALRDGLRRSAQRVIDLFRRWDVDGSNSVDRKEFRKAIRHVGFDVEVEELDMLFDELDPDRSGSIDFRELNASLRQGARR